VIDRGLDGLLRVLCTEAAHREHWRRQPTTPEDSATRELHLQYAAARGHDLRVLMCVQNALGVRKALQLDTRLQALALRLRCVPAST
jgi:hypothetical protein